MFVNCLFQTHVTRQRNVPRHGWQNIHTRRLRLRESCQKLSWHEEPSNPLVDHVHYGLDMVQARLGPGCSLNPQYHNHQSMKDTATVLTSPRLTPQVLVALQMRACLCRDAEACSALNWLSSIRRKHNS